jgi:hypothetical protein
MFYTLRTFWDYPNVLVLMASVAFHSFEDVNCTYFIYITHSVSKSRTLVYSYLFRRFLSRIQILGLEDKVE